MITVTYDPQNGQVVPDGEIAKFVDDMLSCKRADLELTVGSGTMVNEFRLRVARAELSHRHIQFVFNGEVLIMNEFGRMAVWPKGFADYQDWQTVGILTAASISNRKAKEQS